MYRLFVKEKLIGVTDANSRLFFEKFLKKIDNMTDQEIKDQILDLYCKSLRKSKEVENILKDIMLSQQDEDIKSLIE